MGGCRIEDWEASKEKPLTTSVIGGRFRRMEREEVEVEGLDVADKVKPGGGQGFADVICGLVVVTLE